VVERAPEAAEETPTAVAERPKLHIQMIRPAVRSL
jgi:hypothetical protein